MDTLHQMRDELVALDDERASTDLSSWRKAFVFGPDARGWLHDLVTADVESLQEGSARRSLLLTPTGRIRADFTIAVHADHTEGFLLYQDPRQPEAIADLLAPYVLSSAVTLEDRTESLALYAALGAAGGRIGWAGTRPSALGPGMDVITGAKNAWRLVDMMMKKQLTEVGAQTIDVWRIRGGIPRFGVDLDDASMPNEADLEPTIDFTKGCFLGQEAVAKTRNLGHPARIVRALRSDGDVAAGTAVHAGNVPVGVITSAAPEPDDAGSALIGRIRWEAAEAPLTTPDGRALRRTGETA